MLVHSHLSSLSHCGLILGLKEWSQSVQAIKGKKSASWEWIVKSSRFILTSEEKTHFPHKTKDSQRCQPPLYLTHTLSALNSIFFSPDLTVSHFFMGTGGSIFNELAPFSLFHSTSFPTSCFLSPPCFTLLHQLSEQNTPSGWTVCHNGGHWFQKNPYLIG